MLSFDGHDLESLFVCGSPEISILNASPTLEEFDSRNGAVFLGQRWGVSTVAFSIAAIGNAQTRRNAFSQLGAWLAVDEPKKLILPDTPDRYYLAAPEGQCDLTRGIKGEMTQLAFTLVDPIAYSMTETTITVPSGGNVTFTVGGTAAAKPTIRATATRNSTALVWGLRLDSVDFVHVNTGVNAGRVVAIDCDARTVTISGNAAVPTLDSDWLEFTPGSHTLVMDYGTGAATVKYRERWL